VPESTVITVSSHPLRPRDRTLVVALQHREPDAIERIVRLYGPTLRGFLTQTLGDAAEAEDVLQQTLTEAWRRGASYAPERGSLLTWLLVIARSRAIDQLRRRIPEPYDPADLAQLVDPSTEDHVDALLERWRMAGLLAGLPREESRLLALRFYEGLTQREIAAHTGIALGTVKMRMAQGLERLRLALAEDSP
jgi:RNA polymerase sigma-70 factor (ECF subfamily)